MKKEIKENEEKLLSILLEKATSLPTYDNVEIYCKLKSSIVNLACLRVEAQETEREKNKMSYENWQKRLTAVNPE